jgi:hypothetical protein
MQPMNTLYEMFEIIQSKFSIEEDEEVYRRLIEIFGDLCRLNPMSIDTRPIFDTLGYKPFKDFVIQSHQWLKKTNAPWDYFGRLYESLNHVPDPQLHGCGCTKKKVQGINLTPEWIVQFINEQTIAQHRDISKRENRPIQILDPACGTGRFLFDALNRNLSKWQPIVYGIEKYLWLYRTCLVNCSIYFRFRVWNILCADSLINDCMYLFLNSNIINQWSIPHWEDLPIYSKNKFLKEKYSVKKWRVLTENEKEHILIG